MASGADLRRMALALPGTREVVHFDRAAFTVARIYVTLDNSGQSANFKFSPDEQILKCQIAPEVFQSLNSAWGRHGWTTAVLAAASAEDLQAALEMAHAHAVGKPARKR